MGDIKGLKLKSLKNILVSHLSVIFRVYNIIISHVISYIKNAQKINDYEQLHENNTCRSKWLPTIKIENYIYVLKIIIIVKLILKSCL